MKAPLIITEASSNSYMLSDSAHRFVGDLNFYTHKVIRSDKELDKLLAKLGLRTYIESNTQYVLAIDKRPPLLATIAIRERLNPSKEILRVAYLYSKGVLKLERN